MLFGAEPFPKRKTAFGRTRRKEAAMSPATILIALLIICFFAVLPTWPHASRWGYYPSLLVAALILAATLLAEMS
jgi:Protein of unknown function (DUF3309)